MQNDIRHVSEQRLDQLERDARGLLCQPDAGFSWDQSRLLDDVRRERMEREE